MAKKAWIFQGGWDGHEPKLTSARFGRLLEKHGYEVEITDNHEKADNLEDLLGLDLIVAAWTMGEMKRERSQNIAKAVGAGVGLAGAHGGMCDAFRQDTEWQFMTGGQWVSHPGGDGVEYVVNINHGSSSITEGIEDFKVASEHYYLHIDPAIEVLATTRFPVVSYYHISNKPVDMPIAWTKFWGNGRVFYTSLGHHDDVFDKSLSAEALIERGMLWAAEGKAYAAGHGLTTERFENQAKMY
ncbi:MAG: ThuA domain-containing protein [Oscillospiraceae bacterium]|jgi:type 1 glutamine amidotransferase|nr:ThuA domain-containing protein [Oscillospiraceae bacterium]